MKKYGKRLHNKLTKTKTAEEQSCYKDHIGNYRRKKENFSVLLLFLSLCV